MITCDRNCTGCRACEQKCPVKAISMETDKEGFLYPIVRKERCIECGICDKVCPVYRKGKYWEPLETWAVQYRESGEALAKSASGGAFLGLAKYVIQQSGIVIGAAYMTDWRVEQIVVDNTDDLEKLQGSKYVQSDTGDSFRQTEYYLKRNKMVLYSGTPCQIDGLLAFLGIHYVNLITVDVICHGVPSPILFNKYMNWLETCLKEPIIHYEFRDKQKGWGLQYRYRAKTKTREKSGNGSLDPYYRAFLKGYTYRESCYSCPYARRERKSDITIGDCWGIEKMLPKFVNSRNGVSIVIVNTQKGKTAWENIEDSFTDKEISMEDAIQYNNNLAYPTERPIIRDTIYNGLYDEAIFDGKEFKIGIDLKGRLLSLMPWELKRVIKKWI